MDQFLQVDVARAAHVAREVQAKLKASDLTPYDVGVAVTELAVAVELVAGALGQIARGEAGPGLNRT
jgi:hypothetical protein